MSEIKRPVRVVDLGPCFGIEDAEGTEIARTAVVHTSVRPDWAMTDRAWAEEIVAALNAQPVAADLIAALQQNDELRRETVVGRPSSGKTAALNALAEATAPDAGDLEAALSIYLAARDQSLFGCDEQPATAMKHGLKALVTHFAAREAVLRVAAREYVEADKAQSAHEATCETCQYGGDCEAVLPLALRTATAKINAERALATPSPAAERLLAVVDAARAVIAALDKDIETAMVEGGPAALRLADALSALDGGAS